MFIVLTIALLLCFRELSGVVTMSDLTYKLSNASIDGSEPVSRAMMKKVEMVCQP